MNGMELLIDALRKGSSQDPGVFKPISEQLRSWETNSGFFPMLAKITSDFAIDFNVRWLASMYLKNGIERYWRKAVQHALPEEEKAEIRRCLLQNYDEPYKQIAVQLSTLISRLARLDFPKDWPELLPTLSERTKASDCHVQERALTTLYCIVCQLTSKRLASDRRAFRELTAQLYDYILELWSNLINAALSMDVRSPEFESTFERSRICAKILRKLIVQGFKNPCQHSNVNAFIDNLFLKVKTLVELRKLHENLDCVRQHVGKYVILLIKIMVDLLQNHPFSFIQFIKPGIELCLFYLFSAEGERMSYPRLVVQGFNLMKSIIACYEYRASTSAPADDLPETKEAVAIKKDIFTPDICVGVCNKLMMKYLILTKEELELWESSPEEFWTESVATECEKYNLRAAIENMFIGLFRENMKVLVPFLAQVVKGSRDVVGANDINAICQKDAIYALIGLGSMDFFDSFDFDDWFANTLIHELKIKDPNYRILRRRVTILIGQCITWKFSDNNRQLLYETTIHLLSTDEDLVVRMAAANTLKCTIADFEFDLDNFLPYVSSLFSLLYELLIDVKECETKLMVLHVMSTIIEIIGVAIKPHMGPLVQYLPMLWLESQEHDMLRCGIISVLANLTIGLMSDSENIHGFLISVVRYATDVREKSHVYLMEDGLYLWLVLVENCTTAAAEPLLDMFENIFALLDVGTHDAIVALQITIAYTVLCPQPFLARYGQSLVKALIPLINGFHSDKEFSMILSKAVEMILRVLPCEGAQLLRPILPIVIANIMENADKKYTDTYSMHLVILSRVVLAAGDIFNSVVTEAAGNLGMSVEVLLEKLLTKWWGQIPLVVRDERRKICAMSLAELCSNNWPPILNVWGHSMTSISELIFDITEAGGITDKLVYTNEYITTTQDEQCGHVQRMKAVCIQDPVNTIPMREFLALKLKIFERNVGPAVVAELFQTLEEDCKKLLREVTSV